MSFSFELLAEIINETANILDDIPISRANIRKMARNCDMTEPQCNSAIQNLLRRGLLEKKQRNEFLITPKAVNKLKVENINKTNWTKGKWDKKWIVVVFDIPESKRKQRNLLRSFLKRKNFYKLQNSVFISPFADFEQLDLIRHEYDVAKYVNIFVAQSSSIDNDSMLKKHFGL